jgi:6-phosphogluconolactonase
LRLERRPSAEEAARLAAAEIAAAARAAVERDGTFGLALSGGSGPLPMYEALAGEDVPWDRTRIFQVDERVASRGDPERNLTALERLLPPAAAARLEPMPVEAADLERAAADYAQELPERLDLAHLGIGPDGHTASLVPGDEVLSVRDRAVAVTAGEYQGRRRMTMTYPYLEAARRVLWLVTGDGKREALAKLLAGDPSVPAGRLEAADALIVADDTAAG